MRECSTHADTDSCTQFHTSHLLLPNHIVNYMIPVDYMYKKVGSVPLLQLTMEILRDYADVLICHVNTNEIAIMLRCEGLLKDSDLVVIRSQKITLR